MLKTVAIIGAGPSGIRAARALVQTDREFVVKLFNGERADPYHRAQLSYYLAGDMGLSDLNNDLEDPNQQLSHFVECMIENVDTDAKILLDNHGNEHSYDKLIIATGSRVAAPPIVGRNLSGVHFFRSIADADTLKKSRNGNQNIYVIGSGPLGIETALAMKTPSNSVYLQVRRSLFAKDLDDPAKGVLSDYITSNGVTIIRDKVVTRIHGSGAVQAVELNDQTTLDVQSVVMCTGITPCCELAQSAGIEVERGIVVNDFMQTSAADVYAVGECAEHEGKTHGLVGPGYDQADVCVRHITGNSPEAYKSVPGEMQFKFRGFSSHILGDVSEGGCEVYVFKNTLKNVYRKLLIKDRMIKGAIVVGSWSEAGRVAGKISNQAKLKRRRLDKFTDSGFLWNEESVPIQNQPADYIICLCQGVTRGDVSGAMKKGHRTIDSLGVELDAGITCGSCQPLLSQMLDQPAPNLIMRHHQKILWASVFSVIVILLTTFVPKLPFDRSVQFSIQFEQVWYGSVYKQTTGYILLGLSLLSGAIALRKRWKPLKYGNLDNWRYIHTILGLIALVSLIVHTGFRFGENLNFVLMSVFMLATLTGSLVGVFMSRNHHWTDLKLNQHRAWWSRVHYGLLWMLPSLLGFHIISSYYFA